MAQIRYACVYWVDHLCDVDKSRCKKCGLHDNEEIHSFLEKHFFHWLEALSLMRHMTSRVVTIKKLENLLSRYIDGSRLLDLVRDELRFILHNRWIIENASLQAYAFALIFSSIHSLTRQLWKNEDPEWIITKPIVENDWSPCLQTLEGYVYSVATPITFDPTGSYLLTDRGLVTLRQSLLVRHIVREPRDTPMIGDNVSIPEGIVGLPEPQWHSYGLSSDQAWIT